MMNTEFTQSLSSAALTDAMLFVTRNADVPAASSDTDSARHVSYRAPLNNAWLTNIHFGISCNK